MGALGEGILASILATVIVAGGATVLTWAKKKWPTHGDLMLYWLMSATCLSVLTVIVFAAIGYKPFAKPKPPEITNENVEEHVRAWAVDLGMAVSPGPSAPEFFFTDTVTLKNTLPIVVGRAKDKTEFLQFQSPLSISPEHQAALAKMTVEEANIMMQEILLELARSKVGYTMVGGATMQQSPLAIQGIMIQATLPIASNINEGMFSAKLDEVNAGVTIARATVILTLTHHAHAEPKIHQN
jgi:hypothetical protein